jgi:hypothetical protein
VLSRQRNRETIERYIARTERWVLVAQAYESLGFRPMGDYTVTIFADD